MSGNDRTDSAKEFTMTKYNQSGNGTEFVALQLALDFEDFENRKLLASGDPAPVDPMAERPASSEPAPPVPAAGEEPTTEAPKTEEKPAAETAKTDKEKPAEAPVAYTPILDETISMMGCSNKAHPKCTNIIQVLYAKEATNAMM